jgi:pimeloyl-ACP methyl ester carboxylesterase
MVIETPASFEQQADIRLLQMSDGSCIRVLSHRRNARGGDRDRLTLVFVGGWCTTLEAWDRLLLEACKLFDVVVFESREKSSSRLSESSVNDLDRVSLDLSEALRILEVDQESLVVLASSWGTILVAHAVASRTCLPVLSVFLGPIGRLTFPPFIRSILPRLPCFVLSLLRPLAYVWIAYANAGDWVQARRAIMVLANAEFGKWTSIGRFVVPCEFWGLFARVNCPCLIVYSEDDKFHNLTETHKIIGLIPNVMAVHVEHTDDLLSEKVIPLIGHQLNVLRSRV